MDKSHWSLHVPGRVRVQTLDPFCSPSLRLGSPTFRKHTSELYEGLTRLGEGRWHPPPFPPKGESGNSPSASAFSQEMSSPIPSRLSFFFFLIYLFYLYLFLAALSLHCCAHAFSSCGEQGLLFVAVRGLLIAVASLVAEHGL